jgi:two-component system chemotaxis response regulator CheB
MIQPIKVLVVDDSAFMRMTLARRLGADPGIQIVGLAADGNEAVAQVQALHPDVVTMDVEMPGLDGLDALARIMAMLPTPVVMVSSLTSEGAETTVRALTLGAVDFVTKPSQIAGIQQVVEQLAVKIRQAAATSVRPIGAGGPGIDKKAYRKTAKGALASTDRVLIIGSSTGGPGALRRLLADLPPDLNSAGVIVQHMPRGFTRSLASRLDEGSAWSVREAAPGDSLTRDQFLVAPGGYHLTFGRRGEVILTEDPPVNNVRPAVDVTMESLAHAFPSRLLGVVLTGMGHDGTQGALAIRRAGGRVVVEDQSTCVVYGMPRSVVEAGAADCVAPLPEIPALVTRLLKEPCCE